MKRLKNCSGVTLIEIIIGIVISVVIMGAMYASYTAINNSYSQVTDKAKASQTGRNVLGMMMRDLRQAGFKVFEDNITNDDEPVNITPNEGGVNADVDNNDCDHIRIVYGDATLDAGQNEVYERYRVTYFCRPSQLTDPDGDLEATNALFKQKEEWVNNGWTTASDNSYPPQLITDYVEELIFIPKDRDGVAIDPPPQDDPGNTNRMRVFDIRAVEIALTTRSRKNFYKTIRKNVDNTLRRIFEINSDTSTPINDLFLRETTVLSVSTRNVGLE